VGGVDRLFDAPEPGPRSAGPAAPLAARMRPTTLDEVVGQEHLLGTIEQPSALRRAIDEGRAHSMVLYGPPGSGKTTLARLVAATADAAFEEISAVEAGRAEVRAIIAAARERRQGAGRATILFLDFTSRRFRVRHVRSGSCHSPVASTLLSCGDAVQFVPINPERDGSIGPTRAQSHARAEADVGRTRARSCAVGFSECARGHGSTPAVSSGRSHD